ncbi:MAG: GldG family protein [Oscillospiraceae bacterium]|nr:GldG family protein [Oscillospiraceae bacterium]
MNSKNNKTFNFSGILALVLAILILVIAIPINLIVSYFDFNIDMTPSKMYTLSDTSVKLLDSVRDKEIEFTILCELDDIKEIDEYLPLYYALEQYKSYENIDFNAYYPDEYPERVEELNPDGFFNLTTADIVIRCGNSIRKISSNQMFSDIYDDNGNIVEQKYVGENLITGAIKAVTEGDIPQIYFLTGHGEKSIEDYSLFTANLNNYNYTTSELNLSETKAVPDDAAIIFVCAPQHDITLEEKKLISEYTENGGNLAFLMSPDSSTERYTNIEDLMFRYNLAMDYNRLYESDKNKIVNNDKYTIAVSLPETAENSDVDLTTDLNTIIEQGIYPYMCESRTFKTVTGPDSMIVQTGSLLQADVYSVQNTSATIKSEPYGGTEKVELGNTLDLAYYAHNTQNDSKMIVMGNAEFMDDEHVSAGFTIIPLYLCLSSITWMYDSDVDMEIEDKTRSFDNMVFDDANQAKSVMAIMIAIPIVFVVCGAGVWLKRRNS